MNVCLHRADFSTVVVTDVKEIKHDGWDYGDITLVNKEYEDTIYKDVLSITINVV